MYNCPGIDPVLQYTLNSFIMLLVDLKSNYDHLIIVLFIMVAVADVAARLPDQDTAQLSPLKEACKTLPCP